MQQKIALKYKGTSSSFPTPEMKSDVISILSWLGCCEMPTPCNLAELIVNVAKYEFVVNQQLPLQWSIMAFQMSTSLNFWTEYGINDLYTSLTFTSNKILKIIDGDCWNPGEEWILAYQLSLIGNMGTNDIRNFLRFTTGSSVCIADKISVAFNSSSDLARHPIAHTCSNTLELSASYINYHDFLTEWHAILSDTNEWKWHMDGFWVFTVSVPLINM